eukprot:Sspe_Gene.62229::Locus_34830_Transcript_1_1_Confidence_1.000_Length_636::g.62229::m.62229
MAAEPVYSKVEPQWRFYPAVDKEEYHRFKRRVVCEKSICEAEEELCTLGIDRCNAWCIGVRAVVEARKRKGPREDWKPIEDALCTLRCVEPPDTMPYWNVEDYIAWRQSE